MLKTLSTYIIESNKIFVFTGYSEAIITELKDLGGKWEPEKKAWAISLDRLDIVYAKMGNKENRVVQVKIPAFDLVEDSYPLDLVR